MRFWVGVILLVGVLNAPALEDEIRVPLRNIQQVLQVPGKLANITDANITPSQDSFIPEFILIQDVHRHAQIQAQIADLIVHGYERWGVRKVFLEGAFTPLDMSVFHRVPNKTRTMLLERLVKDGDLSGPELAAVTLMEREWRNPPVSPFQLFGMEDPKLYRQNVMAYQSVLNHRERALQELLSIRRLQDSMHLPQNNVLNEQLDRTEALLRLRLTPGDYQAYLNAKEAVPSTPVLDPAIRAAEAFYRFAQLRSQAFLKMVFRKVPASDAPRILVVGGFHTAYMADYLRRQGHTFVVLAPTVAAGYEDPLYEKRLKETASVLAQALPR